MGWTSFKLDEPIKEWFRKQWECNSKYKVLDSALLKRTTMYGAVQFKTLKLKKFFVLFSLYIGAILIIILVIKI